MNKKNSLSLQMAALFLFVILFLGYLILEEKGNPLMVNKTKNAIRTYVEQKYPEEKDNFKEGDVVYQKDTHTYQMKLTDKRNEDWFFTVTYHKEKDIKDDYKTSYQEGKSLLKAIEKKINKDTKEVWKEDTWKNYQNITLSIEGNLEEFEKQTQTYLIEERKLEELEIYTLHGETKVPKMDATSITEALKELLGKEKIKIKSYQIKFLNQNNLDDFLILEFSNDLLYSPNLLGVVELVLNDPEQASLNYGMMVKEEMK